MQIVWGRTYVLYKGYSLTPWTLKFWGLAGPNMRSKTWFLGFTTHQRTPDKKHERE